MKLLFFFTLFIKHVFWITLANPWIDVPNGWRANTYYFLLCIFWWVRQFQNQRVTMLKWVDMLGLTLLPLTQCTCAHNFCFVGHSIEGTINGTSTYNKWKWFWLLCLRSKLIEIAVLELDFYEHIMKVCKCIYLGPTKKVWLRDIVCVRLQAWWTVELAAYWLCEHRQNKY